MIRGLPATFAAGMLIVINLDGHALALDAIESAERYTVKITTAADYPFSDEKRGTLRGAGFLVDRERGWILTNAHLAMKSPSKIRISFKNQTYLSADKLYVDNRLDLAVLRIDPDKIPTGVLVANLKCEDEPPAGLPVIAFGHPWSLDYTATRGIISGTKVRDGEELLQTDAALNPGNSGGALIDAQSGAVVGVNTSRLTTSEGLSFAVPAKLACGILNLLAQNKDPAPPVIPLTFATTSKERELVIAESKGEWSELLKPGDRILAVNGDEAAVFESRFLMHLRGAEKAQVRIQRGNKVLSVELTIPKTKDQVKRLGVHVSGMIVGRSTVTGFDPTVMWVQFVDGASIAEQAQFSNSDQILSIDGTQVKSHEDILAALKTREGRSVEVIIRRPKFTLISGRFDYFVRTLDVQDVFLIDERGRQN